MKNQFFKSNLEDYIGNNAHPELIHYLQKEMMMDIEKHLNRLAPFAKMYDRIFGANEEYNDPKMDIKRFENELCGMRENAIRFDKEERQKRILMDVNSLVEDNCIRVEETEKNLAKHKKLSMMYDMMAEFGEAVIYNIVSAFLIDFD